MKERYVKPALFIESYALTQTIASNCGAAHESSLGKPLHDDIPDCAWDANGIIIFTWEMMGLGICEDDVDDLITICYNNPEGGTQVFNS